MNEDLILIHTDEYANWVLSPTHPTQGRRFINARNLIHELAPQWGVTIREARPAMPATPSELAEVHDRAYINEVINLHTCGEWEGKKPELARLAELIAGGTLMAVAQLYAGFAKTVVHLPGAKHHAMRDHSSGFCVFNDFAMAALNMTELHHRVAILDIDAHRGDGVEALTADNPNVLTFSIHDESIFPWSPGSDIPRQHVYNRPLPARSTGKEMLEAVNEFIVLAKEFDATMIFITAGADGHITDPLSTLRYADIHYRAAASRLRRAFPDLPMLVGGAGGYQPDTATPRVWATFALTLAGGRAPRKPARAPVANAPRFVSLAGIDAMTDEEIRRLAVELWSNFTTTEGEPWQQG